MPYIDSELAVSMVNRFKEECKDFPSICLKTFDIAINAVKLTPIEDVEKIKYGEWLSYPSDAYVKCSVCRMEYLKSQMPKVVDYCPHCGSKMYRGEDNA